MTDFKKILNDLKPDKKMVKHFKHKGWMVWEEIDSDSSHPNNIKNHIDRFLTETDWDENKNKRILDIACGNGLSTYYLSPFFEEIHAMDYQKGWRTDGIEHLKDVINKEKVNNFLPKVSFEHLGEASGGKDNKNVNLYYEQFDDNYFDYIFMVRVGHFFDKPYIKFNSINEFISGYICDINQLHRILKKNGFMCVSFSVNSTGKSAAPIYKHSNRNNNNRGFDKKLEGVFEGDEINQSWKNLRKLKDDKFVLLYPEIDNNTEFMFILKAIK